MFSLKTISALTAVAALALPAVASAQAVAPLNVQGRAPTEVRIALVGKAVAQVKREISVAANTVCHNAVSNRELAFYDVDWCKGATETKARARFAAIVKHNATQLAETTLTLAAR